MYFFLILGALLSHPIYADEETPSLTPAAQEATVHLFPEVKTIFPVFLGGGIGASFADHFALAAQVGVTPKPYSDAIADLAAKWGGNDSYRGVIQAAFQSNFMVRVEAQYHFTETKKGWHTGFAVSHLSASGAAGIDQVLSAATGLDYSTLKSQLAAAGKSTVVDLNSTLWLAELQGGYAFQIAPSVSLSLDLGVVKVVSSGETLQTGLPNFEKTRAGQALISSSQTSLESILSQYGISPTLGLTFSYVF